MWFLWFSLLLACYAFFSMSEQCEKSIKCGSPSTAVLQFSTLLDVFAVDSQQEQQHNKIKRKNRENQIIMEHLLLILVTPCRSLWPIEHVELKRVFCLFALLNLLLLLCLHTSNFFPFSLSHFFLFSGFWYCWWFCIVTLNEWTTLTVEASDFMLFFEFRVYSRCIEIEFFFSMVSHIT